jgi:hypothetical protein
MVSCTTKNTTAFLKCKLVIVRRSTVHTQFLRNHVNLRKYRKSNKRDSHEAWRNIFM